MKKLNLIVSALLLALTGTLFGQSDTLTPGSDTIHIAYNSITKNRLVGAVDYIDGSELLHSNERHVGLIMGPLAAGMYSNKYPGSPGTDFASLTIRGLSRGNFGNSVLVVVDGIPMRSGYDFAIDAIESITILKDATAKILYGSTAANGVINIKTKRGFDGEKRLSFSVESGIKQPTFTPTYLDAATYADKYNEARENDGLAPLYTPEDITKYDEETHPLTHPNEDYVGAFIGPNPEFQRINSYLRGGNDKVQYFLNLQYQHEKGLEAIGDRHRFNQLNLTSNVDYFVNDIVSMNMDIHGRLGMYNGPPISGSDMYWGIANHRPNDYPFFMTSDQSVNTDSLAYNPIMGYNLYGQMTRGGYYKSQDFKTFSTLGIKFDFDKHIKGLSANASVGFDSYNNISQGKSLEYASYRISGYDSLGAMILTRVGNDVIVNQETIFGDNFHRNVAGYGKINYTRTFGEHSIIADLVHSMRILAYKGRNTDGSVRQDLKGISSGLNLNYAYSNKYIVNLSSSYMGSDKFERGNRFQNYMAGGAAWVVSEEDFLSGNNLINYLKLKTSYGVLGYDLNTDYYLYRNLTYGGGGVYYFGVNNANKTEYSQRIESTGNPNITFEESQEMNIGMEASLLNNLLSFEINYFNEIRSGIPTQLGSTNPGYYIHVSPYYNYNEVQNTGYDITLNIQKNIGDLSLSIGGNLMYSQSVYNVFDELNAYKHQNLTGKATDAVLGLNAEGLYQTADEIDVISTYGSLNVGDIKYTDYVQDGIIDNFDDYEIGHTFPRLNYAVNLNIKYKGIELYVLGQGISDVDRFTNSSYYHVYGERKYSEEILSEGYPRLTTSTTGGNNFQNSTFWMVDGSFFKIRTVELSYSLPKNLISAIRAEQLKLFARGTDLLTITNVNKVDPEAMNAGITNYPMFKTGSVGLKIIF